MSPGNNKNDYEGVNAMNSIFARRSVRKYLDKPVEQEKVERLLQAAMQAPSAGNQRPWEFIVVREKETLRKLAGASPYATPVFRAPAAIVVLGNLELETVRHPEYLPQDLAAATENLLLQAAESGLGAVWLGIAPLDDRMAYIRELFQLPESVMPFAIVPVGYAESETPPVNRYETAKVHEEKYKKI